jgi:uncharacterized protein YjdB
MKVFTNNEKFLTMKKILLFLLLGLAGTLGMTSCENDNDAGPGEVPLTDIRVDRTSISENVRYGSVDVANVRVYPIPANATDVDFKWESQNTAIATAIADDLGVGRITVLSSGTTVVTVRSGNVSKQIQVEGRIDVTKLEGIVLMVQGYEFGADSTIVADVGAVITAIALPNPVNANTAESDNVTLVWTSSSNAVARVNQNGEITVVGKGSAVITVSCREYEGISMKFTVVIPEEEEE